MIYDFNGVLKDIKEVQTWDSGFKKREIIVISSDAQAQEVKFELLSNDVTLVDALIEGQEVNLKFELRGNEWNGKHFVNLVVKSIDEVGGGKSKKDKKDKNIELPLADDDIPF